MKSPYILHFREVGMKDVARVGGKNASLGEMIQHLVPKGVRVPDGFVVTADAYREFLGKTNLGAYIRTALKGVDTGNLKDLARRAASIREAVKKTSFPEQIDADIRTAYREFSARYGANVDVAVRSSATAEDLPGASFAGEHDTFLNIRGEDAVVNSVRAAMASLFTDRAISYRVDKGFDHLKVALSVGVQKMVRSDLHGSGVMFTVDTESGFKDLVIVNGAWGLGEMIVQGEVTPDEFLVYKGMLGRAKDPIISKSLGRKERKMVYADGPGIKKTKVVHTSATERSTFILTDREVLTLAEWGVKIEEHYTRIRGKWTPMDTEWAKDGRTGELYIVQARPETVQATKDFTKVTEYVLDGPARTALVKGASVGSKVAVGPVRVIEDARGIGSFKKGEVLVTTMTDPDWEPIMKIAAAIVTDKGGRTSHAAIVSRELGIACIVGTENATKVLNTGEMVTVDTTGSEGFVYDGKLKFSVREHDVKKLPKPKTKILVNIATPDTAFEKSFLPAVGVGLAREEFIIVGEIGIHPNALIAYKAKKLADKKLKTEIARRIAGWKDAEQFYIDKLAYGIAKIGAAFFPRDVIVRFSDFKTNEYRTLLGGEQYEPKEENPMIGWRGASRYYHPAFSAAFALECRALVKVRDDMGLSNVIPMIPFCRTVAEGKQVLAVMAKHGLDRRKDKKLKVYMMCEIPSNVVLADEFLDVFDGMSIGSNDLTQLTVGIDRDGSDLVRGIANERDASVKKLIAQVVAVCRRRKKYIGICGQGPSDYPDFAEFLVDVGIESMSLNPDTVVKTVLLVAKKEKESGKKK